MKHGVFRQRHDHRWHHRPVGDARGGRCPDRARHARDVDHRSGDDTSPGTRARRYDEALEIVTQLWSGDPVTFHGELFDLDEVTLPIVPVQQPGSPCSLRAGGPIADRSSGRRVGMG